MGEMAAPTPAEHVRELLARAQNPFDVADAVMARLESAVLCEVRPQSARGADAPASRARYSSYRHNFLLADGSCLALWELRYTGPHDGRPSHEVYDTVEALAASRRRLQRTDVTEGARDGEGPEDAWSADGGGPSSTYGSTHGSTYGDGEGRQGAGGPAGGGDGHGTGAAGAQGSPGCRRPGCCRCAGSAAAAAAGGPGSTGDEGRPERRLTAATGPFGRSRRHGEHNSSAEPGTCAEPDSPDHARRLLRRAENDDRPGDDVRALLATALAHEIVPGSRPRVRADEWQVWCSVYEHAFLLADGSEMRLYELEHNLSRSGRLTCEVYLEEAVADRAAHRHARARGLGT